MLTIGMVGLGEAGKLFGEGLARAGATVRGHDPFAMYQGQAIEQLPDLAPTLRGADLVISFVGVSAAQSVARDIVRTAESTAVFADFNTVSPPVKLNFAEEAAQAGLAFVDVAVMAPVPRAGHRTPLLASGSGAAQLDFLLSPLGARIDVLSTRAGDAASLKLVRSVFMKGLAALVLESLEAADAVGSPNLVKEQIIAELSGDGAALVERLVTGTRLHAGRRLHEVEAASELLRDLGVSPHITEATIKRLSELT